MEGLKAEFLRDQSRGDAPTTGSQPSTGTFAGVPTVEGLPGGWWEVSARFPPQCRFAPPLRLELSLRDAHGICNGKKIPWEGELNLRFDP